MKNLVIELLLVSLILVPGTLFAQAKSSGTDEHGIRWADEFPGATAQEKINAAIASCGPNLGSMDQGCLIVISPKVGCGEPNQAPDHVMLWDLRGCAQSQGLRFNLPRAATGRVRSKVYLQDNFTVKAASGPPEISSATLYVHSLPDSANVTKGTIAAVNGTINTNSLSGDFNGTLVGIEGEAFAKLVQNGPYTVHDIRGGTFNTNVGKGVKAVNVTSLYAQAPAKSPGGEIANAYSLRAEAPNAGTNSNLAGWFNGDVKVDTKLEVGKSISVGGGEPISKVLLTRQSITFGMIGAQNCSEKSVTLKSSETIGTAFASPTAPLGNDRLLWSARVGQTDTVYVRLCNIGNVPGNVATVTWSITVVQ